MTTSSRVCRNCGGMKVSEYARVCHICGAEEDRGINSESHPGTRLPISQFAGPTTPQIAVGRTRITGTRSAVSGEGDGGHREPDEDRTPNTGRLDEFCEDDEFVETVPFYELFDLLDNRSMTIGIAGPRGAGKSALLQRAFLRKTLYFRDFQSEKQLRNLPYTFWDFQAEKIQYPEHLDFSNAFSNKRVRRPFSDRILDFLEDAPLIGRERHQWQAIGSYLWMIMLFAVSWPLCLPIIGEFLHGVWSRGLMRPEPRRNPRDIEAGGSTEADAEVFSKRGPLAVDPIPTPTRYDEKQFLQSLFDRELKAMENELNLQIPGLNHVSWFPVALKVLVTAVAVSSVWNPLGFPLGNEFLVILAVMGGLWTLDNFLRRWPNWPILSHRFTPERRLSNLISERRQRLTFDQTYTSSTTTGVGPVTGFLAGLNFSTSSGVQLTRQPYTRVGLVEDIREFAQEAMKVFDQLYVGIDELDKMHDTSDVRAFLRGIKGIFSLKNVCYVLTVSEEAVNSFDLRNLSGRDELDSSFREVVDVGSSTVAECDKIFRSRGVILGTDEMHMLAIASAGNARELLRQATAYNRYRNRPCESCNYEDEPFMGYLSHMIHLDLDNLRDHVRQQRFKEEQKHTVIKLMSEAIALVRGLEKEQDNLLDIPEVAKLRKEISELPWNRYDSPRVGVVLRGVQDDSIISTDELADSGAKDRTGDKTRPEDMEAAHLKTIVRLAIFRFLTSAKGQEMLSLDAGETKADIWLSLVETATIAPLEAADSLKALLSQEPQTPGGERQGNRHSDHRRRPRASGQNHAPRRRRFAAELRSARRGKHSS